MGRTLTIKKGGPSPYSEGWHTAKITSAEYGEWNDAKYIDVYFDGYSAEMIFLKLLQWNDYSAKTELIMV